MKKVVCLGTSIAGVSALAQIRQTDPEAQLICFAFEPFYPFRRETLADFVAKDIGEDEIYYKAQEFYKEHRIEFILDKRLGRINFKRNQITTEDKETILFDTLLISETPQIKFPDIKGTNKAGVFSIRRLNDIKNILQVLPLVDTAIVVANTIEGVQMACALRRRGKEVCLVFSTLFLLPETLDQESAALLMQSLEEAGIRLFYDNEVVEILGEGEVKAVRLATKKVISAEMIIFDNVSYDLKIFGDSQLVMNNGITVDSTFKTNFENVYALNDVCEPTAVTSLGGFLGSEALEEDGKRVAAALIAREYSSQDIWRQSRIVLPQMPVVILGESKLKEEGREFLSFNPTKNVYRKIFAQGDCLTGAVLMNAESDVENLFRIIREKVNISGKEEELLNFSCQKKFYVLS